MIIDYLGIRFRKMKRTHIEQVRQWRNSEHLRQFMHYQEFITEVQQDEWFNKVDNPENLYLVAEMEHPIGLVFLKEIDIEQRQCEMGFLVGETASLNTIAAGIIQICMMDIAFYVYNLNSIHGHVLTTNKRAMDNYRLLGAENVKSLSNKSILMEVKKGDYERRRTKLIKAICKLQPQLLTSLRFTDDLGDGVDNGVVDFFKSVLTQGTSKERPIKIEMIGNSD